MVALQNPSRGNALRHNSPSRVKPPTDKNQTTPLKKPQAYKIIFFISLSVQDYQIVVVRILGKDN